KPATPEAPEQAVPEVSERVVPEAVRRPVVAAPVVPGAVPWWVVAVLVVGAVLLVVVNWPGAVDSRRIWSDDSNTGWRVYRSWFDPEILASVVVLVAGLAARWKPVAMGIALGAVLSIGEDAFLFLAGGLAAEETAEWLVAGFIALILAVAIVVVLKPQPRPWPVRAPAFTLIVAGGIVLLVGTMIQHNDGLSFSTVTKLALLEPFVTVALGWLAIAAIDVRTRSWLTATAITYALISMVAAVPALTEGKSAPDLLAGLLGNLLVIAGVRYAAARPPLSPLDLNP
ncbi:MAG: hypothetical protein QOH03_840, partial [Kribbellaceae bacterium]|nr:hypothetical protein [Kribbellaceae bacterium]